MNKRLLSFWRIALACAFTASVTWGCGGGVGLEGTGSAVTLASGPITGFGSIVVNGVAYDNSSARVDDLGGGGRGNDDLRLGMVVEVQAEAIDASSGKRRAVASRVRLGSELLGPVDSKNTAAGTLVVLGQTVRITTATVFDDAYPNGLDSVPVAAGAVEVFGFHDPAAGQYVASRLQPRSGSLVQFRLRGPVSGLNTATRSFSVYGQRFSYDGVDAPAGLADGAYLRLALGVVKNAQGQWPVRAFDGGGASLREAQACEFKGLVTALDPAVAGLFSVNGTPVDARAATLPAGLALGVRVEVKGTLRDGVLLARELELQDDDDARDLEFEGRVASVDRVARTFRLVGQAVDISYARPDLVLQPAGATLDLLERDVKVEVRAVLGSDRRRVEATVIEFDD